MRLRFYFLKQTIIHMKENLTLQILSLGTIVASLFILGAFLLLFGNVKNWLEQWGSSLTMSIYLKDDASAYKRDKIDSYIRSLPGARIRRFISKKEAMEDLKSALGDEAGFIDALTRNPLPASYEVVFEDNEDHGAVSPEKISGDIRALEGVEDVQYSREWLKRFEGFLNIVRVTGYIIGCLLCLCVVFIVTNTIKLTIYSRRDEIEILKLVGATDCFVKLPFVLEGMLQGLLGGIAALLLLFVGYRILAAEDIYLIGPAPLEFSFLPLEFLAVILGLSVLLGILGSFIAIGRFVDV